MPKDRSFSPDVDKASSGEVLVLALIAGVILAALTCSVAAMLLASKMSDTILTGFSIGTVFGVSCGLSAIFIAFRRSSGN